MTQPSKEAIAKRHELIDAEMREQPHLLLMDATNRAFARFIDHVSETAKEATRVAGEHRFDIATICAALILPDPEPDVLLIAQDAAYETGNRMWVKGDDGKARQAFAEATREELTKRGYEIRKIDQ